MGTNGHNESTHRLTSDRPMPYHAAQAGQVRLSPSARPPETLREMAKPVSQRRAEEGRTGESKNGRQSTYQRAKRPYPATRHEADETFRPAAPNARAKSARLFRANELGLLHPEGRPITQGEAHQLILDALYPPDQAA